MSKAKSGYVPVDVSKPPENAVATTRLSTRETETSISNVQRVDETKRLDSVAAEAEDTVSGAEVESTEATEENGKTMATSHESSSHNDNISPDAHDSGDDHSAWETVEAKSRGTRSRRPCTGSGGRSFTHGPSSAGQSATGPKKNKKSATSRRRNANRKMVREVVSSVLDGVDVEARKRRSQVAKSIGSRAKVPSRMPQAANGSSHGSAWQAKPMTMRDVVLGRLRAEADMTAAKAAKQSAVRHPAKTTKPSFDHAERLGKIVTSNVEKMKSSVLRNEPKGACVADQSTAPTVPETLSGISANTQTSCITDGDNASMSGNTSSTEKGADRNATIDYSSSGDIAVFTSTQQNAEVDKKVTSPAPPLQTLPWPATANSATSSVASSLEVPHGRHLHHRHSSVPNENDVGYHLLDVCDRLSRDMDVFMGRRAVALIARRQERGALLAALQDTASVSIIGCLFCSCPFHLFRV